MFQVESSLVFGTHPHVMYQGIEPSNSGEGRAADTGLTLVPLLRLGPFQPVIAGTITLV